VIPKVLRDRYGLDEGAEVEVIAAPDGITLVPSRSERRIVRRGRVVAIDTGAEPAPLEAFDIETVRQDRLQRTSGVSE
jgi:AbrB family looped-hinge helix DNA binding protein